MAASTEGVSRPRRIWPLALGSALEAMVLRGVGRDSSPVADAGCWSVRGAQWSYCWACTRREEAINDAMVWMSKPRWASFRYGTSYFALPRRASMALVFLNLSPMAAGSRCCCSVGSIPCVPRLLGKLVYPPSYFAGGATVGSSANVHCGEADEPGRLVQRKHFCIVKMFD